jgi:hypothetical protein
MRTFSHFLGNASVLVYRCLFQFVNSFFSVSCALRIATLPLVDRLEFLVYVYHLQVSCFVDRMHVMHVCLCVRANSFSTSVLWTRRVPTNSLPRPSYFSRNFCLNASARARGVGRGG